MPRLLRKLWPFGKKSKGYYTINMFARPPETEILHQGDTLIVVCDEEYGKQKAETIRAALKSSLPPDQRFIVLFGGYKLGVIRKGIPCE